MKRIKKAIILPVRKISYRLRWLGIYYWAEMRLLELRTVYVMPAYYYRWLFNCCMGLVEYRKFRRLANWMIHTIPYHIRFAAA